MIGLAIFAIRLIGSVVLPLAFSTAMHLASNTTVASRASDAIVAARSMLTSAISALPRVTLEDGNSVQSEPATVPTAGSTPASGADAPKTERPTAKSSAKTKPADASKPAGEPDATSEPQQEEESAQDQLERTFRPTSVPELSFSTVEVRAGEYVEEDLVCIGGHMTIAGLVKGDVVVIGGVLEITGHVSGDTVAVASRTTLGQGARLDGEFVNVAGRLDQANDVRVGGEFTSVDFVDLGRWSWGQGAFVYLLTIIFWIALIATAVRFLGTIIIAAIAPQRVEGALLAPKPSWILAFLIGFVVRVIAGILFLILLFMCVTAPVAIALWLAIRVAIWMGTASISLAMGRTVGRSFFGTNLSYFGAILTGFLVLALVGFIPVLGFLVTEIVSSAALGLMLLTRFGGRKTGAATPPPPVPQT